MDRSVQVGDKVEITVHVQGENGRSWINKKIMVTIMQITKHWIRVKYPAGYMRCFQRIDWRKAVSGSSEQTEI